MGNSKPIEALFKDLGVPAKERDHLRQDILKDLSHSVGSERKACKLPRASVRAHVVAFIDAEEGRGWFKRSSHNDVWSHSRSRVEVVTALTELTIKWLKSRRVTLKRKDAGSMTKKNNTSTEDASASKVNRLLQISTSSTAFVAVNTEHTSADDEYHHQVIEYTDEETDPSPDKINDDNDDDESLMDITEVLSTPVKVRPESPTAVSPTATAGEREETTTAPHCNLGHSPPPLSKTVESPTPAQMINQSLLSPSATGSKREAEDMNSLGSIPPNNLESREGAMRKRVRLASGSMSPQPIIREPRSATEETTIPSNSAPPTSINQFATPSTAGDERTRTPEEPALLTISLSNTSPFAPKATYNIDALGGIPAMILDYISRCRQSSLTQANAAGMGIAVRRQYQERCRLFRDLYADIESRILSL